MKWAVVTAVLMAVAFLVGNGSGWALGRRSVGGERAVVVTATPAAADIPAGTPAVEATAEEPTAAAAWEECDGDDECLDRQCPGVLGAPEGARTGEIGDCVYWLSDLPSADPRREVDRERLRAELCRRGPGSDYLRYLLGYSGSAGDCQ